MNAEKIVNAYLSGSIDAEDMERQIKQLVKQKCKEQRELCADELNAKALKCLDESVVDICKDAIRNAPRPFDDE